MTPTIETYQTVRGTVARFTVKGVNFEALHDLSGTTSLHLISGRGARVHVLNDIYHAEGYSPAVLLEDVKEFIGRMEHGQTH